MIRIHDTCVKFSIVFVGREAERNEDYSYEGSNFRFGGRYS